MSDERATISVRAFQGADEETQHQMIPARPGLYVWTHDLGPLLGADQPTVQSRLLDMLSVVGRDRSGSIRPYYRVTVRDERKRISDAKRIVLHERLSEKDDFGEWLSLVATQIQRPLYVGMTLNLLERITTHLGGASGLRARLQGAKVDMLDLAVTWVAAPLAPPPDAGDSVAEDSAAEPSDFDGDDEPELIAPELDSWLKAAESLLIRLAMPMFNEKQD